MSTLGRPRSSKAADKTGEEQHGYNQDSGRADNDQQLRSGALSSCLSRSSGTTSHAVLVINLRILGPFEPRAAIWTVENPGSK
jgi:hypothetical protein